MLALVTPEVEIETPGGVGRGSEAVRQWVDKQTQPHAVMHIVLDQLLEAGDWVVVFFRAQMAAGLESTEPAPPTGSHP